MNANICSVNILYKFSEVTQIGERTVRDLRYELGQMLARRVMDLGGLDVDYVCPVPNSGIYYAKGFVDASGYKYREIMRKTTLKKSFYMGDEILRKEMIEDHLDIFDNELEGKKLVLVDEAIFTGTTLKVLCARLKEMGVAKVYAALPAPSCVCSCPYGAIPAKPMLLEGKDPSEAAALLGADGVIFQEKGAFDTFVKETGLSCTDCFATK